MKHTLQSHKIWRSKFLQKYWYLWMLVFWFPCVLSSCTAGRTEYCSSSFILSAETDLNYCVWIPVYFFFKYKVPKLYIKKNHLQLNNIYLEYCGDKFSLLVFCSFPCLTFVLPLWNISNYSLHLTTFCLQYKPTVIACVCIHLACKWSNWEIPVSTDGKHWWEYVDPSVTLELLDGK